MSNNLTISDIANMAGVAKSTVSRYLNGGRISESTSKKIKKIIDETNYEPNAFAQSLKAKKTKFIGIIAPCLDSVVTSKVIMAIDEQLREQGYNSLIINTSLNKSLEVDSIENLVRLKVDGIILVATEITNRHKEAIEKLNIPMVVVGQRYPGVISIINDDYGAGNVVGNYIAKHGHRDILYLGVSEEDEAVGKIRKKGILDSLNKYNKINVKVEITDFSIETSEKKVDELINNLKATAIICATDKIAMGALKSIIKNNKKVPEDISLIGFGGYELSTIMKPSLTTIKFNNIETGKIAALTLIKLIQGEEVLELQTIEFDLIERNSVKNLI